MKLVINVPDYIKEQADDGKGEEFGIPLWLAYEIANGTPFTEKAGRWIPVEDRLPEDGIYLVTVERTTGKPIIETKSFAKDLNRVDDYDFPEHKCGWYEYDSEYGYWEDTDVIAWQSLPQPYKATGK